ncbi:alpha/beta hydrolase family protein [Paenibacillus sp. FSL H3-0333]|uniref:alpha/beta hydrolase family protein n=1 Tax=Paenibacillus sp. FSL H3-0333 TaxID=2921373 RepID=UPI0030F85C52
MRVLEIILTVSTLLFMLSFVFRKLPLKVQMGLTAVSITLCAAQLWFEGYRWQMAGVYVIVLLGMFIRISGIIRGRSQELLSSGKTSGTSIFRLLKRCSVAAGLLMVIGSAVLSSILPVVELPAPEGPYAVGVQTLHLTDSSRPEPQTPDPGDSRELMVYVWYPAAVKHGMHTAPWLPGDRQSNRKLMSAFAGSLRVPSFALDYWRYIHTNAYPDADWLRSEGPYPLILINHGLGSSSLLHTSLAENLASNGYIVAAVDHTYSSTATLFPDGTVTGFNDSLSADNFTGTGTQLGNIWNGDNRFVLGQLKQQFADYINAEQIGVIGHSFGGAAAYEAMFSVPAMKAGIDMDGSLYTLTGPEMSKPFLFIESEEYYNVKKQNTDPDIDAEEKIMNDARLNGGGRLYIKGTAHYNFTDLQLYSSLLKFTGMTGSIDSARSNEIVNRLVLDFFNEHLKGIPQNAGEPGTAGYDEVVRP